jgi:hypothetical protein
MLYPGFLLMIIDLIRPPRICLSFLAAVLGISAHATDLRSTYVWQPVRIGGGGWVTGLVVHPTTPNLIVARTDVGGAYKWDAATSSWTQLVTTERFPTDFLNASSGNPGVSRTVAYQVESIALAPSDPSRIFLAAGSSTTGAGRLFRSTDGGASFALTNLSVPMAGNADFRYAAERLAVKPDDASIVLFGSRNAGLWRSTDGGVNWTLVPATQIPFGASVDGTPVGINAVLFDLATPSRVYASVAGDGVYRSDDAGLTWTQILGGGIWPFELEISQGIVFAAGPINGFGVRRYDPATNTWSTRHPAEDTDIQEIAVDPANASRLYAAGGGFKNFYRSTDGGLTWTSLGTHTSSASGRANFQSPFGWKMSSTLREWLSMGTLAFDPHYPGRLWFAEGMGVWRSDDIAGSNPAPVFHDVSHGIEEMVANDAIALPGGRLVTAVWDRLGFVHTDLTTAPSAQLGLSNKFLSGWALATSPSAPDFVAVIGTDHHNINGVMAGRSFDGGATWTRFGSITASGVNNPSELRYGELVASATNVNHLAWLPRHGAQILRYTTDGGATWQNSSVVLDDWNAFFFGNRRRLAADGAIGGKFYLYQWTNGAVLASTDGGATFADTGGRLSSYTYHSQLKGVPGHANHLWFAAGRDLPAATHSLRRSTDGGATWQSIPFFDQAWAFGYGKSAAPGGYPTVFVYGRAASGAAWGVWRSSDAGASWARVADYPLGLFDTVTTVTGDPEVFGKVYVGFSGNSFAFGAPATAINSAPSVTVALQAPVTPGQNIATLVATVSDDGLPSNPGTVTTTWTQLSGPAIAQIATPEATHTIVTFPASGIYTFSLTAHDGALSTTATLSVHAQIEAPVATSVNVTPATANILPGATESFTASVLDQYGNSMSGQLASWSVSGGGSINNAGLFTAGGAEGGPYTVTATSGILSATATVIIVNNPPTISNIADRVVAQNVATGPLAFTIGDAETDASALVVTATSSNQILLPDANLALDGSGANRTLTATPATNQTGTATVTVTVNDGAKSASDTFLLTVVAGVVTSIDVSPAATTLQPNGTQQFVAIVRDQNGAAMFPQPTVNWSATGSGTVTSSGLFTAASSDPSAIITAAVNSISGSATVTITNTAPAVTITSPAQAALALPDRTNSLVLSATATDAEVTPTVIWSQVSGPGTATFANANSPNTSVSFSADGTYVLRITASDGILTATDEVSVTVGGAGGLGTITTWLSTNFSTGVTSSTIDKLYLSSSNGYMSIAFTGGGRDTASPMWTVADPTKVDFKQINSVTFNGFTWGASSDPIRYGSVFATGTDFGYVIGASNSTIRYTGTGATQPLVQFSSGTPASGAFNFVFEIKGGESLSNLTVKFKAGTANTSGVWHANNTAAQNGNYNVSIHPLDSFGNAGAGFTFYSTNQPLGAGGGITVTATDQGASSLSAGTYLLRIQFLDKTITERY